MRTRQMSSSSVGATGLSASDGTTTTAAAAAPATALIVEGAAGLPMVASRDGDRDGPQLTPQQQVEPIIDRILAASATRDRRRQVDTLTEAEIRLVLSLVHPILLGEPMLLQLDAPVTIVGDVHGQLHDLRRILMDGGDDAGVGLPPHRSFLFLGDYVNRGRRGIETAVLLFALKVAFPGHMFLLRGNHECASITRIYGFYDEVKRRFNVKLWKRFNDVFNVLPVSAVVEERIFCTHGGLSPELETLDSIARIARPTDVPDSGLMCDLLWGDPERDISGWADCGKGVSYGFGPDVVDAFLKKFNFDLVCRAHQVVQEGYDFLTPQRTLVTLFSAPNYCDEFDNSGAVMHVAADLTLQLQVFPACSSAYLRQRAQHD